MRKKFKELATGIRKSGRAGLPHLMRRFARSPEQIQQAMTRLFANVRELGKVEFRVRGNGLSFYVKDEDGSRRECGYFGINPQDQLVVYHRTGADDPRNVFRHALPTSKRYRYGAIDGESDEVDYVIEIFRRDYRKLSGTPASA